MAQPSLPPRTNDAPRASPGLTNTSTAAGLKRKRTVENKFYAVRQGKKPGIYETWADCLSQVKGHKGAVFKAFQSLHEAQAFMEGKPSTNPTGDEKFYAVQNGRVPGVYTDWTQAQAQIRGIRKPKHKKFNTRAEAEAFVAAGKKAHLADSSTIISPEEEIRRLIVRNSAPGLQLNGTYAPLDKDGNPYEIGRRPLPPGAEDGYDPNLKLAADGTIVDRTEDERNKTKMMAKERDPPGMLRIYTDGSSLRNGQAGARAGVGVFFGPQDPKYDESAPQPRSKSKPKSTRTSTSLPPSAPHLVYTIDWGARRQSPEPTDGVPGSKRRRKGHEMDREKERLTNWRYRNVSEALKGSKQTNQRAELTAILRALDITPRHREVTIYTDSKYAIDCVTNWYRTWRKNGWVNAKGKPVENKDLIVEIRHRIEEREQLNKATYFVWVKGHKDDVGNIAADRLAVEGAMRGKGIDDADENRDAGGGDNDNDNTGAVHEDLDDETAQAFEAMEQAMEENTDDEYN
ncbi:uncharacterized protein Z518_11194 [Rhinocladiella mackenziei CBS 650.93]|uniref:Ribonuclease H n=1 Tax=Rhinocladiella mackenziei CBS 650.93 TaxID=1442369 RepID=A0A0D2I891_9EURO|nr:uncharacterized protein Z518_11194 [Rhinocladiella mackenziei CBS 650.93]KIW99455.1 hypothetical protein Z518_11194 [Rhinocladiella mackenziei CBS 650.93]